MVGEPPSYRTILAAQRREAPVGWTMDFDSRRMGWALSTTTALPQDLTEIRTRVHFDELPLPKLAPSWLPKSLFTALDQLGQLELDTESLLVIDPLGRLSRFESSIRIDPMAEVIHLTGTVEDDLLDVEIRTAEMIYSNEARMPPGALLGDSLSPQTQLPGLRVGQTWTVPAYSLFRPPNNPLEILQATVEGTELIRHDGRKINTYVVVYRTDVGTHGLVAIP